MTPHLEALRTRRNGHKITLRGLCSLLSLTLALLAASPAHSACVASNTRLCLLDGRFSATLRWDDGSGPKDALVAAPKTDSAGSAAGLFYFYPSDPSNWEVLTKMIDGCGTNNRFWLLVAASTGFGWDLSVKDESSGVTKTFSKPLNGQASGIANFEAFDTCSLSPPSSRVRFLNSLVCNGAGFAARLLGSGLIWESFTGLASPYQDVSMPELGPFDFEEDTACPSLRFNGTLSLSPGRRYTLKVSKPSASIPSLDLVDDGPAGPDAAASSGESEAGSISGVETNTGGSYTAPSEDVFDGEPHG